jgi:hypothetical protein
MVAICADSNKLSYDILVINVKGVKTDKKYYKFVVQSTHYRYHCVLYYFLHTS